MRRGYVPLSPDLVDADNGGRPKAHLIERNCHRHTAATVSGGALRGLRTALAKRRQLAHPALARPLPAMSLLHSKAEVLCTKLRGQQRELARGVPLVLAVGVRAGASGRHPVTHTHTAAVTQSEMQAPTKKWKMSGAAGRL